MVFIPDTCVLINMVSYDMVYCGVVAYHVSSIAILPHRARRQTISTSKRRAGLVARQEDATLGAIFMISTVSHLLRLTLSDRVR